MLRKDEKLSKEDKEIIKDLIKVYQKYNKDVSPLALTIFERSYETLFKLESIVGVFEVNLMLEGNYFKDLRIGKIYKQADIDTLLKAKED